MKIGAIICELNPFHDGHRYIFSEAKKDCDILIAVMSGNYVQRGEAAIFNKYSRASDLVREYADLCVEIPFPFSCSSAEFYAKSGIFIAENLVATDLYFGSESGDINALKSAANILNSEEYIEYLKEGRAAEKREEFLKFKAPSLPESVLSSPNDILATEYVRNTKLNLHAIKRISTNSATKIREQLINNNLTVDVNKRLREIEFSYLRTAEKIKDGTFESGSGILEWMRKCSKNTNSPDEVITVSKTKQYTDTRLRRAVLFSMFNVQKEDILKMPKFTNILAMSSAGKDYIASLRKQDIGLKLLSNYSDSKNLDNIGKCQFELNSRLDGIYTYCAEIRDPTYFSKKHTELL